MLWPCICIEGQSHELGAADAGMTGAVAKTSASARRAFTSFSDMRRAIMAGVIGPNTCAFKNDLPAVNNS